MPDDREPLDLLPEELLHRLARLWLDSPNGMLVEDADRRVVLANEALVAMFGVAGGSASLVGADAVEVLRGFSQLAADPAADAASLQRAAAADAERTKDTMEFADGRVAVRECLLSRSPSGARQRTWRYRDITAQQRARAEAEVEVARRTRLLTMVSHDVRTPMVGIVGLVDLLLQQPLDAATRELISAVELSTRNLTHMLDNVLDLERADAGRLELSVEETSICALIEEVAAMVGPIAQAKQLPLLVSAAPDLHEWIRTDPGRLRQVLLNILSNAVKFTASGVVAMSAERDGADLLITVEDTGPGMSEETMAALFEEYAQGEAGVHRSHGGAGLGMAIAHRLTTALGGRIEVRSRLGEGSAFVVRLLGAAPTEQHQPRSAGITASVRGHPMAVRAVVPALRRLGIAVLEPSEHAAVDLEVAVAASVADAQQILPSQPGGRLVVLVPVPLATCPPLAGPAVSLPWRREQLAAALLDLSDAQEAGSAQRLPTGTSILLAEDEPANRRIITEMLTRLGAQVTAVGNGLEALDALAADRFDVVLLDLGMPVMDGRRAAAEMRLRLGPQACPPILALTADAAADPAVLARSGFAGQVAKPLRSVDLVRAVGDVLGSEVSAQPAGVAPEGAPVALPALQDLAADIGDAAVVEQTLEIYLEELPGRLEAMSAALAADALQDLRDGAHSLKSSSRMLGMAPLADLCRDLEAVTAADSRTGASSGGDLTPMVDAVHAEALRVGEWLSDYRSRGYPGLAAETASGA